ncbi:hypothetical protein BDV3_004193 [Batrachochytrium dendrobatidis]|nr:hypothetical protein O5D80_008157 [Batrachochytrium dendrobatidis]KAK5673116.1 hypothetical protein QVD99_000577 [Batrachochytrium dendrobatidis]
MSLIGKKFGQFKQWTGEKLGNTQRTETSDEFKRLETDTGERKACIERFHSSLDLWYKTMIKRPSLLVEEKIQRSPIQALGNSMILFGTFLPQNSIYGQALLKSGQVHDLIASEELQLSNEIRDGILSSLTSTLDNVKEYYHLHKKLENRRLDFDAKLNKVHKTKKESPELEEETRACQTKYEETLTLLTEKMIELNTDSANDLQDVLTMIDAELAYHQKTTQLLADLKESLSDIPRQIRTTPSLAVHMRQASVRSNSSTNTDSERKAGPTGGFQLPGMTKQAEPESILVAGVASMSVLPGTTSRSSRPASIVRPQMKRVKVSFDFDAENSGELTIRVGDIVTVLAEIDEGWWRGEMADGSGRSGIFPSNYCEVIPSTPNALKPISRVPSSTMLPVSLSNSNGSSNVAMSVAAANNMSASSASTGFNSRMAQSQSLNSFGSVQSNQQYITPAQAINAYSMASKVSQALPPGVRDQSKPLRSASHSDIASAGTASMCGLCGCNDYVAHAFKIGQCNNCYHKH